MGKRGQFSMGIFSGKKYTTPVNYVLDGNVILITSLRSLTWWRNLTTDPKISIRMQGNDINTFGEVIEDHEEVKEQLMRYLQKVPQYAKYFKVDLDPEGHPNPEDVVEAAKERVIILLRLSE